MRKWSAVFILILVNAVMVPCLSATPAEDEDFGIWSQNDIEYKFDDKWRLKLGEEVRFREHAGITYFDTHAGVFFKGWQYLGIGADYLQVRQTRSKGRKDVWYWEERPRIYATPQIKIKGFNLENRSLLEFRIKQQTEDTLRYRNMTTLTAPWKWTKLEIQPYAANEVFFESNRNGLVEDRLYGGVKYHVWKGLHGSLFYLRQFSKNSSAKWKELNILGIGVKVSL